MDINSQTIKHFKKLLSENKKQLLSDQKILVELFNLKDFLSKLEDDTIERRSTKAAKDLSEMTEEERRMLLMTSDEKKFFLEYKMTHPNNPWMYFKEYQKKLCIAHKAKTTQLA